MKPEADYLFEASWEVCNKVGGINTVLKSKAVLMTHHYQDYFMIGPYFAKKFEREVLSTSVPDKIRPVLEEMNSQGIKCHYGRWQIKGEPNVILLDFSSLMDKKDEIKTVLWDKFGVDSISSQWDFEEPMLWSWAAGMLLEKLGNHLKDNKMVAHAHEWLAGISLLYLKQVNSPIKTVFTTHATMLGRSIAGIGRNLYEELDSLDAEKEAKAIGVSDKFTTERASARECDVFTTVSEITGLEAEKILGRKPDILVLNGLDVDIFPTIEETSIKHVSNKEVFHEYLTYHFFPYYTFDLKHTILLFIVGRYEFKNKGIDIFINALGRLNERLQRQNTKRTVCVFFWIPNATKGIKTELLENKNVYRHIKQNVDMRSKEILKTIVQGVISQDDHVKEKVFTKDFQLDMKKDFLTFRRVGNPLIFAHNIENEDADPMKQALLSVGLDNKPNDKVKVIVYPVYLDGNDGLINLPYYEAMAACHLGVFPSYYEPWGYTPLESAAMGVSSITTDLSGYGLFIDKHLPKKNAGIYLLRRHKKSEEEILQELEGMLYKYCRFDHAERVHNKINAKNLSYLADWKHLIKNYIEDNNLALTK